MYSLTGCARTPRTVLGTVSIQNHTGSKLGLVRRPSFNPGRSSQRVTTHAERTWLEDLVPNDSFQTGSKYQLQMDGPPNFSCLHPNTLESAKQDTKPIMVYLPGIDGTGLAAYRQFPSLEKVFSLIMLTVPVNDRTPFPEIVDICVDFFHSLAQEVDSKRPIYILGESFGAVLAVAVAAECKNSVDRVVMVNPATSYSDSPWPNLRQVLASMPTELYQGIPYLVGPVMGNPLAMAGHAALLTNNPIEKVEAYREGLINLLPVLGILTKILPQATLDWKLQLLADGNENIKKKFSKVRQRTLVVVGENDVMLPSSKEGPLLEKLIPVCFSKEIKGASHAMLQEAGVDLQQILIEEGFFTTERKMSGGASQTPRNTNNFMRAGPVELPTLKEFERGASKSVTLRSFVSPVWFSTDSDGVVHPGLDALALTPGKPALLIANHQTVPTDLAFIIEQVFREKQLLIRGLTHPGAFAHPINDDETPAVKRNQPRKQSNSFGDYLAEWGAVPVGAKALYTLLRDGECVLLYPGGAQEALKGTNTPDRYKLYWSSRPEFVRAAAKFGATIIPVAGIGAEEQVRTVLDAPTFTKLFLSDSKIESAKKAMPQARKGVNRVDPALSDALESPLYLPVGIERYYFMSGKPIETSKELVKDKEAAAKVYKEIKAGLEDCITYLLENRERDPHRNLLRRVGYERLNNAPAPTFTVEEKLNK